MIQALIIGLLLTSLGAGMKNNSRLIQTYGAVPWHAMGNKQIDSDTQQAEQQSLSTVPEIMHLISSHRGTQIRH
jgi:hypothetical protein